ncbi:MAG: hypothetical protein Q8M03_10785, partial [Legionella sp.]|nr:hypothetical protein [Legionella sp.]
ARRHGDTSLPPAMPVAQTTESEQRHERAATGKTVSDLVDSYRSHEKSPYLGLRFSTRTHYDVLIKPILRDCGPKKVGNLKEADIEEFHKKWAEGGKMSMAKSIVGMLRSLVYFGATELQDRDCESLSIILHRMKFAVLQTRNERLTAEQVLRICELANKAGRPSLALAMAFQWDCNLRQKDVIGEWIPINEEPENSSDITDHDAKWLRGLRWEEIDSNFVLTHITSKNQKRVVIPLREKAPLVTTQLNYQFDGISRELMPDTGPVIVSEASELPWIAGEFRRWWRRLANQAGVPPTVKNMDSRERAPVRGSDMERAGLIESEKVEIKKLLSEPVPEICTGR